MLVIIVTQVDDLYVARAPELPGCMGSGDTRQEAEDDCRQAALQWLDEAHRLGWMN